MAEALLRLTEAWGLSPLTFVLGLGLCAVSYGWWATTRRLLTVLREDTESKIALATALSELKQSHASVDTRIAVLEAHVSVAVSRGQVGP